MTITYATTSESARRQLTGTIHGDEDWKRIVRALRLAVHHASDRAPATMDPEDAALLVLDHVDELGGSEAYVLSVIFSMLVRESKRGGNGHHTD